MGIKYKYDRLNMIERGGFYFQRRSKAKHDDSFTDSSFGFSTKFF